MSNEAENLHDAGLADAGQQLATIPAAGEHANEGSAERARPVPRISIQVFCETQMTAEAVQAAAEDRRLAKTHVSIHMG